ncbi:MAG TPA: arginine deiminase family protein [Roseiflexaceae bacterium]|nr:arginine deiminase family protein [Roseiflexaceae bacterium]
MTKTYGGQSMIAPLRRVLVRRPDESFGNADPLQWHYTSQPDLARAQAEHDALVATLRRAGAEVVYHDVEQPGRADSIFVFDPALITDAGAIALSMGKTLRRGEEAAIVSMFERLGIPLIASLEGKARAEGGDMLWLDEATLAVGLGFRTNAEGVLQLRSVLEPAGVTVLAYDLPYFTGPEACLHLLSLISIVDERLAVVHPPLMSTPFWQELERRGFNLIVIPEHEFATQATNVLAIAPGQCLMLEGNPETKRLLEQAGCEVQTYRGEELSLKAEGGPTCLTRPILRGQK